MVDRSNIEMLGLFDSEDIYYARELLSSAADCIAATRTFVNEVGYGLEGGFCEQIRDLLGERRADDLTDAEVAFIIGRIMVRDEPA